MGKAFGSKSSTMKTNFFLKRNYEPVMVARAYNPSYSGGKIRRIVVRDQLRANSY
jgi:hypothetical protein